MYEHSDEGDASGLGFIPGNISRIQTEYPVPHLGWNNLVSKHPMFSVWIREIFPGINPNPDASPSSLCSYINCMPKQIPINLVSKHPMLNQDVYFVHSYQAPMSENVIAYAQYDCAYAITFSDIGAW
jgi:glutamine amidotransferase